MNKQQCPKCANSIFKCFKYEQTSGYVLECQECGEFIEVKQ